MTTRHVIGQTGSTVLSHDAIKRKRSQRRTIRYRYRKIVGQGYIAEVIGPFHSAIYGAIAFGTSRKRARSELIRLVGNRFGYLGHVMLSDIDSADLVGIIDPRLVADNAVAGVIRT